MRPPYFISLTFSLLLAAVPVSAELRQWTDEHGVKHFSNKKELPEGVSVERSYEEKESSVEAPVHRQKPAQTVQPRSKPTQTKQPELQYNRKEILAQIQALEEKKEAVFARIYSKRRYAKRQGKKDIDRIRRLNSEIKSLEDSGSTDPGTLERLRDERNAAKERLFNDNLRTRKGVGEDIQEYRQLEKKIESLRKQL